MGPITFSVGTARKTNPSEKKITKPTTATRRENPLFFEKFRRIFKISL